MPTKKNRPRAKQSRNAASAAPTMPNPAMGNAPSQAKTRSKFGIAVIAFCSAVIGVKEFAYPIIVDYKDGKFGSNLELTINNAPLNQDIPTYVFFPAGDAKQSDRYLIPVGLSLRNDARVKAADVTLSVRFEKEAHRAAMDEFIGYSGSRPAGDIKSETNGNNRYDFAVHRVSFLAPREGLSFSEGGASRTIPANLAPYEPLLFSAHQGMDVHITALSDRDEKQAWDVRYRALAVRNMDQMSSVIKTYYAKQVALELQRSLSTWEYLRRILFGKKIQIVAYDPEFKYMPALALYVPVEKPKEHLVYSFDPYKLSLLFDQPKN